MAHVNEGAVGQLIEEAYTSGSFIHEVVQSEAWADTLRPVELVLAVLVFLAEFSRTSRKLDKAQETLVGLVLQTLEPRIVRVRMIRRQLVHVAHQHVVRDHGMVLV